MNFKWNSRLRTTAGACFNRRSIKINENLDCERVSRIELSTKVNLKYFINYIEYVDINIYLNNNFLYVIKNVVNNMVKIVLQIIDTAERLRDTLIHELCHAACWIFNGVSEGHGPSWKRWANKAMEKFPELPIIKRCHSYEVQTKFTYKCKKCDYRYKNILFLFVKYNYYLFVLFFSFIFFYYYLITILIFILYFLIYAYILLII